jgi:hypothetical protein
MTCERFELGSTLKMHLLVALIPLQAANVAYDNRRLLH